ncbi:MAG: HAMP domain-containing sensor histidine kinase [Clostridia bacterium]
MEEMLKKLRTKHTLATTLISGLFLLLLMSGFFVLLFGSSEIVATKSLQTALENHGNISSENGANRCVVFSITNGNIECDDEIKYYGDNAQLIIKLAIDSENGKFEIKLEKEKLYFRVMSVSENNTMIYAVYDRTGDHNILVNSSLIIALLYIVSVLLISLIAYMMSERALKPVEDSFKRQRDLIANASHELKTPLTIISTNLSVLESEPLSTVEENDRWIKSIHTQVTRMNGLIQNMLELSKLEQSAIPKEILNLSEVTEGECLAFEAVCFEKGATLITEIQPNIMVLGEIHALERLSVILLDNAIKYSGEQGKIGFRLTSDGKKAKIAVMNTGVPITKEEAEHVFDRFYRADGARANPDNQSFGLGLSIAQATVSAHGGTITCYGIENKGTVFEVNLPIPKKQNQKSIENKSKPKI